MATTIKASAGLVKFDPTGRWLASARITEGIVDIWDATTFEPVATLEGRSGYHDIAFSADGSRVVTAGTDGVVRIWDPRTGLQQMALRGHATAVGVVAFSPDGTRLLSMGDDNIVRVWALDLDDLIAIAKDRLTRSFTDDECRDFLHLQRCPDE